MSPDSNPEEFGPFDKPVESMSWRGLSEIFTPQPYGDSLLTAQEEAGDEALGHEIVSQSVVKGFEGILHIASVQTRFGWETKKEAAIEMISRLNGITELTVEENDAIDYIVGWLNSPGNEQRVKQEGLIDIVVAALEPFDKLLSPDTLVSLFTLTKQIRWARSFLFQIPNTLLQAEVDKISDKEGNFVVVEPLAYQIDLGLQMAVLRSDR